MKMYLYTAVNRTYCIILMLLRVWQTSKKLSKQSEPLQPTKSLFWFQFGAKCCSYEIFCEQQEPPYVDMSPPVKPSSCGDASKTDDLMLVLLHHDHSWRNTHTHTRLHTLKFTAPFWSQGITLHSLPDFRQVLLLFVGAFGSTVLDCSISVHLYQLDTNSYVFLVVCCRPNSRGLIAPVQVSQSEYVVYECFIALWEWRFAQDSIVI